MTGERADKDYKNPCWHAQVGVIYPYWPDLRSHNDGDDEANLYFLN